PQLRPKQVDDVVGLAPPLQRAMVLIEVLKEPMLMLHPARPPKEPLPACRSHKRKAQYPIPANRVVEHVEGHVVARVPRCLERELHTDGDPDPPEELGRGRDPSAVGIRERMKPVFLVGARTLIVSACAMGAVEELLEPRLGVLEAHDAASDDLMI